MISLALVQSTRDKSRAPSTHFHSCACLYRQDLFLGLSDLRTSTVLGLLAIEQCSKRSRSMGSRITFHSPLSEISKNPFSLCVGVRSFGHPPGDRVLYMSPSLGSETEVLLLLTSDLAGFSTIKVRIWTLWCCGFNKAFWAPRVFIIGVIQVSGQKRRYRTLKY